MAWSSELFVFCCGLEFRALLISQWLGVPSYLYFAICNSQWLGVPSHLISSFCHRSRKEKKRIRDEIRLEEFLSKKMVSIICFVLCLLSTLTFSLTHAVGLVGRRASRVRLRMCLFLRRSVRPRRRLRRAPPSRILHRLRLHPRMLFAAASRSVDTRRPSTNQTLCLHPAHHRPPSSAPSTG